VFSGLGKFIPDVEPITVVTVNFLTTDFDVNVINESMTNITGPANVGSGESRKSNLEVSLPD